MKKFGIIAAATLAAGLLTGSTLFAADTYQDYMKKPAPTDCFESREGYSNVAPTEIKPGTRQTESSGGETGSTAPSRWAIFLSTPTTSTKKRS